MEMAANRYYKLILVIGPSGSGKTAGLRGLSEACGYPYVNLNLLLGQKLLELPRKDRPLELLHLLQGIIAAAGNGIVLVDNTEILFDRSLRHDPLRCLQQASRANTIVASWSGKAEDRTVTYAEPGHPEYRRYTEVDALIVAASQH